MYGAVAQWFYEDLAGMKPLEPGYRRIAFRPSVPAGLDRAEATYDSVRGRISSGWRRSAGTLTIEVTIPPTSTGVVYVPGPSPAAIAAPAGAKRIGQQRSTVAFEVGPGRHRFVVAGR